jgi:DnaJ-class molecular chaperone
MEGDISFTLEQIEEIRKNVCPSCGGSGVMDTRHNRLGYKREDYTWMVCISCHGSGARKQEEYTDA